MKKFYKFTPNKTLTALLLLGVAFSVVTVVNALSAVPNPGHDISTLGGIGATGDLLYGTNGTTGGVSSLTGAATGNALLSGGVGAVPSWGKVDLTSMVTGALPLGNGGTGQTTASAAFDALDPLTTKGDLITTTNGTNNTRLGVGTAGQVLTASTTATTGLAWATAAGGGGSPGGSDTQVQFNNATAFGGDADFTWNLTTNKFTLGGVDTGIIMQAITNEPAVPAAGTGHLYAKSIGGRVLPKFVGPSGIDFALQPLMAQDKVAIWSPPGNAVTLPGVFGFTAPTALGTATARNVATTNLFTRVRRLWYLSSAVAGNFAGHYGVATGAQWTVGTGAGLGGFYYVTRFGTSDAATVATARMFVGMTSTVAAPTNVEPSTLLNSIGIGHGAADANMKLYYGGSAAQTPIDLGANFPKNTLSVDMYELILFASPASATTVGYKVTRLNTGNVAEGTLTAAVAGTQLPLSTTLLGHRAWRTNNATALAVGIDVASVYISSDY